MDREINIGLDFSRFPAGRFLDDGPKSGARFLEEQLFPAFRDTVGLVHVYLDDALSYGSSFLDAAFGGLISEKNVAPDKVRSRLVLHTDDPVLLADINECIDKAARKRRR